ncbi:Hsp70 family protein [Actinomadura rayongensis]|uniref:Hsp70 family protein n=1 Tax=Actinomadura rayongensis TaxID=1429076 RepID=A0A6I4W1T7_9ACTN|nr:Hsp70 family protein [Actinomadura rayongensis]MXQ63401.1 Hsp70 family protein [Actinomadura rayongensis]
MTRTTIDFGIDLGTTNSAIAKIQGVGAEIIKNNAGSDTTPSAVMVDRRGRLSVGRAAKERSEVDTENTCVEFKLRMGTTGQPKLFSAANRTMEPEELSAEVLKSLRRDVAMATGEEITSAVITVPAAFELSACDATRRAAELAGLTYAPLLQEPTAAALAYGFQSEEDAFWLVYDFGGGTFDAAVVNVRDGEFTVVNHRGDNFLGGKLIDWAIVEKLLIPALTQDHRVSDLRRGNERRTGMIAKLKGAAESAKIELSRAESAAIVLEDLLDDAGREFDFEYDLRRADVERLIEPFIVRSVNLCRKALTESRLGPGDLQKVLLVGGPTLTPYLRERLADPKEGLGIPLDHSQDPMTVVARGAAIFAAGQRLSEAALPVSAPVAPGAYAVELEYKPMGPDTEPFVGGKVTGGPVAGCTVEFVSDALPPWRSGRIPLTDDGAFTTTLWAERGRANTFTIEFSDATGAPRDITPNTLTYTVGVVDTQPPLTHSIGVGLAGNEVEWLIRRGTPLPARRRVLLRTTVGLSRGASEGMIRIPVLEGEHHRADRNRRIGRLEVDPQQVRRDVPEGSEVDLTLVIDESRLVVARAYVPILDEEFEHAINLQTETVPTHEELARDAAAEKQRLAAVRRQADEYRDERAREVLARIDAENIVADIDAMVDAARVDPDAATTCGKRLLDLKAAIDEAEDELEWPRLVQEVREITEAVRQVVRNSGGPNHARMLASAEEAVEAAITAHDADLLRQRAEEMRQLALRVMDETGELALLAFDELQSLTGEMNDPHEARQLVETGRRAAANRDIATLRHVNAMLSRQLPTPPPAPDPFSTVRRGR